MKIANIQVNRQNFPFHLHVLGCITIVVGMFFSRAAMSMGMMTLFIAALLQIDLLSNFSKFLKQPHLVLFTVYWFFLAISFFWSDDLRYLTQRLTIALPFLVLPFSFFAFRNTQTSWILKFLAFYILVVCLGNMFSISEYLVHKSSFDDGYGYSKVIPTPFKNDHIRYSMAVVIAFTFCIYLFQTWKITWIRWILVLLAVFNIVYLHILSAKSGLLCFYIVILFYILKLLFQRNTIKYGLGILLISMLIPTLAYMYSETFRKKISYFQYSLGEMKNDKKQVNISDEGRIVSYEYAWRSMKQNIWTGIGLGDVYQEMDKMFKADFPERTEEPLLPHNQFLMMGMAMGIPGLIYLSSFLTVFLLKIRKRAFINVVVYAILLVGVFIEPFFETQYGACVFCVTLLIVSVNDQFRTENEG